MTAACGLRWALAARCARFANSLSSRRAWSRFRPGACRCKKSTQIGPPFTSHKEYTRARNGSVSKLTCAKGNNGRFADFSLAADGSRNSYCSKWWWQAAALLFIPLKVKDDSTRCASPF
ncbi:hypothetical protein IF2G_08486 [Cordyceps javanica]|nr:hypothetical protein IF2G_08486 [Cordyceps javanica]